MFFDSPISLFLTPAVEGSNLGQAVDIASYGDSIWSMRWDVSTALDQFKKWIFGKDSKESI